MCPSFLLFGKAEDPGLVVGSELLVVCGHPGLLKAFARCCCNFVPLCRDTLTLFFGTLQAYFNKGCAISMCPM